MSQIVSGQPVEACPTKLSADNFSPTPAPQGDGGPDKWALFDALTEGREAFGLSHRTLSVLRALLTFLPTRGIGAGVRAIVFPSNRTLGERLHGMPESTLRRHLATLCAAGLVTRRDSPNRKRFARNRQGTIGLAYGFDLSPLVTLAPRIARAAEEARDRHEAASLLRVRLLELRQRLLDAGAEGEDLSEATRELRRKPDPDRLTKLCAALETLCATLGTEPAPTAEPGAADSRIERHIQTTDQSDSVSTASPEPRAVALNEVLESCREYRGYFPEPVRRWHDLDALTDRLAPMLGIDRPLLGQARRIMGHEAAATSVLCILEKAATIRSPGAYLRALTQRAERGAFSLSALVAGAGAGVGRVEIVS